MGLALGVVMAAAMICTSLPSENVPSPPLARRMKVLALTVDTSSSRSNIAMIPVGAAFSMLPGSGDSDVTRIGPAEGALSSMAPSIIHCRITFIVDCASGGTPIGICSPADAVPSSF